MSRASVVRLVSSTLLVGSAACGGLAAPASALDPQRDRRTAVPPPRPLLLPVVKLRVSRPFTTLYLLLPKTGCIVVVVVVRFWPRV